MRDVHAAWAWVVIVSNALAASWALAAHYRDVFRRRELWWFTAAAQISGFVQAVLGVGIQTSEDIEPNDFHMLYGFSILVTVGILYSYRAQMPEHRYLLYAGGGFFIMGLGLRALFL